MTSLSRRGFLGLAGAASAGVVLAGCGGQARSAVPVMPSGAAVAAAEGRRRRPGARVHETVIQAAPVGVNLGGGLMANTVGYNGAVPGPEIRLRAGDVLRARFVNNLAEPTTIHWHGLALRNDMDGVPELTQPLVEPGGSFTYEFTAPDPGTFWFHPHVGLQLDRGLYAPLIIEDPADPGAYDEEFVVVLDDWADGLGQSPEQAFDDLRAGRGAHAAHIAAAKEGGSIPTSDFLASPPGDVSYPLYLLNGKRASDPPVFDARPGDRVRLRIINAGGDTPFRVALGGHRLTVTHTDGFPVEPVTGDALVVAMAERYDVYFQVNGSGVFPLVAEAELKANQALAVIRSGPGELPAPDVQPRELHGKVVRIDDLHALPTVQLPDGDLDRLFTLELGGGEEGYVWTINGRPHDAATPLNVREGERVRMVFRNTTTMFHPMHLHGHTFQVVLPSGEPGPRKDTTIVRPNQRLAIDFVADNPGQWMLHCHNVYHQQGGMMTAVSYVTRGTGGAADERAGAIDLVCDWLGRLSTA